MLPVLQLLSLNKLDSNTHTFLPTVNFVHCTYQSKLSRIRTHFLLIVFLSQGAKNVIFLSHAFTHLGVNVSVMYTNYKRTLFK